MEMKLSFVDAVRIVEAITNEEGPLITLNLDDLLKIGKAQSILAAEYIRIKDRIMPA